MAVILAIFGVVLLILGFYAVPIGEISASVLTAFGEIATFSASLLGIDYTYKYKMTQLTKEKDDTDSEF